MMDELDDLRAAMKAATPEPDAAEKASNLALAQNIFDRAQGSPDEARPTSDSRSILVRLSSGVTNMLNAFTSRGGLVATTAIVAVGFVTLTPQGRSIFTPPSVTEELVRELRIDELSVVADIAAAESEIVASPPIAAPAAPKPDVAGKRVRQQAPAKMEFDSANGALMGGVVEPGIVADENTESYANALPNPLKITTADPVSTFSIDVDTAAYSVVRSYLNGGEMPPSAAVRVEELINYFPYDYAAPDGDAGPFKPTISVMNTPWNADTQLVHIALQGEMPAVDARPPLNLVFLIDTSGSMEAANKLPLLKQSFRLMLGQLRPEDQVAIVTYAGSAGQVLAPTAASERSTILAALDNLNAGGSTAGQAGLQQAYSVAEGMAEDGEIGRIILATDGDFNVGINDPEALKDFIADKRDSGTYLSVLGFGRGNLDDATMQALAQNGNGQAAYIDTLNEAQKVLVDQLSGALFPIANDVKIQVEFNPATVAEYRLIGYETRALKREDFNNDKVDAGEIGAGHSVTAIYEITPVGSDAVLNDPLRYQTEEAKTSATGELGFLRLRHKTPGSDTSQLMETPILAQLSADNVEVQFATAIAGFGQLLRGSDYLGEWTWKDAIDLATASRGGDEFGYRAEAISLMRLAQSLSEQ